MRKIPTLFMRDDNNRRYVTSEVTPGCEWVLAGEGASTRKYDGTCVMFDGETWWARREVKEGKTEPTNFRPISFDENTGKTVGWEPIAQSSFHGAFSSIPASMRPIDPGTYELIGPKVNGNPENSEHHRLIRHGRYHIGPSIRTYASIQKFLAECTPPIEGLVFHHPDGRMAKIKRRDFPEACAMALPDKCTQCGSVYETCAHCDEKIIFVPKSGFGAIGEYRHVEPPRNTVGHHIPHPKLHIT